MPPHPASTSKDILVSIRRKYPKAALVREVVINDPVQRAIYNRYQLNRGGAVAGYWAKALAKSGDPVADQVPEGWDPATAKFERRIDGLMLAGGQVTALEVKISVADFRRDTDEKREAWRSHSHRFIYATPRGLLDPSMIPDGCGLWEIDTLAKGRLATVTVVKKATVNKLALPLPAHVVTAMFYRVSNAERAAGR